MDHVKIWHRTFQDRFVVSSNKQETTNGTMGVLWNFFLTSLLLTNAVCILHEKRFLRSCT